MLGRHVCAFGAAAFLAGAAILLTLCVSARQASATPQGGMQLTDNLYGTHFINADEGWAVGAFGSIAHTRDGGHSWRPQVSHTVEQLFSVSFGDATHGWIAGRSGIILHTTDAGESWQAQTSGTDRHLFKLTALDAQDAWAIGDWGTVIATHDGGKTWENHSLDRDVILNGMAWPDPQHGWIVGEGGTILVTSDAGATWTDQPSGVEKTLYGACFIDTQHGWAVGLDGLVLNTTNGGQTWHVQRGNAEVGALEQVGFAEALGNPSLYDIAVVGNYGYAVGDIGAVFSSEDGGKTWQPRQMPAAWRLRWIRSVSLVSGTHGAFVGANGLAVRIAGDRVEVSEKEEHAPEMAH